MPAAEELSLFPFQEVAASKLRTAALNWVTHAATSGVPRYGTSPIPFLGQLKAVTGAGKTPILAEVVGGLGASLVLWTSRSRPVVEQTFNNLRGRYRSLLPDDGLRIIREIPSQAEWHQLLTAETGLTIWLLTTASWNEVEAAKSGGDADARLSLHRPHADWSGSESPWELLRTQLKRPLWIVSDESHNQSSTQLDQLSGLLPMGFFMASATPLHNQLFARWQEALDLDPAWKALSEAGKVKVRTRDVVAEELLKTTLEILDFNSGVQENLDGVLGSVADLDDAVAKEGTSVNPKAIYVVERSNPPKGSPDEARPVLIWRYLVSKGVDPESIAVFTDTKVLPDEAERISSLSQLHPRHRHIIFNQALQEGWDDPEAYVAYFDGSTKSFTRIRQIVGRILRQPKARHSSQERLNTATVYINTPSEVFEDILQGLQNELRLYAPEDDPGASPIRVKTRSQPLPAVPKRSNLPDDLTLPRLALRAPAMSSQVTKLRSRGNSPWADEFLEAGGIGHLSVLSLKNEDLERSEYIDVLRSARTRNGVYLRRRLLTRNKSCLNSIHPDALSGPAYQQLSCQNSVAQVELNDLSDTVAEYFEDRVTFELDPDPSRSTWAVGEYRPRGPEMVPFAYAVHAEYSKKDFNTDESQFAQALDGIGKGVWYRNPTSADLGFSIPLPVKVGDSTRFYPDFIWWVEDTCWAIDTTGRHLLNDKVRGKLFGIDRPRLALVVRGKIDLQHGTVVDKQGWTSVVARPSLSPLVEHSSELRSLLQALRQSSHSAANL